MAVGLPFFQADEAEADMSQVGCDWADTERTLRFRGCVAWDIVER